VINERQLRRILREYFASNEVRPHQSLEKNAPVARESRAASKGQNHFSAAGGRIASSLFAGSVRGIGHTVAGRSYRSNIRRALEEQLPALTIRSRNRRAR
jgi:hypothetical protein